MKFFIDTANLAQIREANEMGVLDGVTTNPSLMAKENIRGEEACRRHYVEICNIVDGDVSAEVIATDFEGMVREGEELAALHPRIVVKLPCTAEGIRAVKYFSQKGIRTNCTLVFSPGQALLAAKAGATYVSPFVGRLDDICADGVELVRRIVEIYRYYGYATQVCILDEDGKLKQIVAAHDVGKAVNPLSVEGQIEGGVVMSMGYALTERYPLTDCKPNVKFGTLGLFRANQIPEIVPIIVEKEGLNVACGAIGIGEITSIPTAPAIAGAYFRYDGKRRTALPLEGTPYSKK